MQQFIPFEDDWSIDPARSNLRLVPYQTGMRCGPEHRAVTSGNPAQQASTERNVFAPPSHGSSPAL